MGKHVDLVAPDGCVVLRANREIEGSAIGAALTFPDYAEDLLGALTVEDFACFPATDHWAAMLRLYERGEAVDRLSLRREMGASFDSLYVNSVTQGIPRGLNVDGIVRELQAWRKQRALVTTAQRILDRAVISDDPIDDQVDAAQKDVEQLSEARVSERGPEAASVVVSGLLAAQDEPIVPGIHTGLADVDKFLGVRGLAPGDLVTVAARTSVGKSVLCLQIAREAVLRRQVPCLVFNLEMSNRAVLQRMVIAESRLSSLRVRERQMTSHERRLYAEAAAKFSDVGLFVDDAPGSTVARIRRVARQMHRRHGIGLVVVDYLQRIGSGKERVEYRALEVSKWTKALKDLALELQVPVLMAAQINRQAQHTGGLPQLWHLKESGSIEEDSDTVLLLHRLLTNDEREGVKPEKADYVAPGEARIILAKHREGPTGNCFVRWDGDSQRFDDLERHHREAA